MKEATKATMQDKNGREMKTGDIVKIDGAYFKNDNGFYYISRTPGDPSWCGSDYSLHKISKRGKISTAKYNLAFWPLVSFCSDRSKNYAANEHNKANATIEVVFDIDRSEVIAHFTEEAANHDETARTYAMRFGEECETAKKAQEIASFYRATVERMKSEDETPEANQEPEAKQEQEAVIETPAQEEAPAQNRATRYTVNEDLAQRAHESVHMSDYKPGSASNDYRISVEEAEQIAKAQKKKVSDFYHDRIDRLLDSYERRLARWYDDYNRNEASCPSWFIAGPANYPVRKHERQMNRERSLWAEYDEIKGLIDKIKAVGTGAVDLADPHAMEMLTEKLEKLKAKQERSKEINAYWRKHQTLVGFPDMDQNKAEEMTESINDTLKRCAWITKPVPDYELTSLRDKIKRTEERLAELDRRQNTQTEDERHEGYTIVRNTEIDRLQIMFDEIPAEEIRTALKGNGFRWSPRYKAWQRQLTDNAERAAKRALNIA